MFDTFIKASKYYADYDRHIAAPYIRKAFDIDNIPKSAKLYICVSGFYLLYLNGKEITNGMLAPGISNPHRVCYYDEYDISRHLVKGKNCIGVILGNGFANQTVTSWEFNRHEFRAPLAMSLQVDFDGETFLKSDQSFKTHPSPIIYDMYRYGVHYNARLEIPDWCSADFDDANWAFVMPADAPKGKIVLQTADRIKKQYELKPQKITKQSDFCYLKTSLNNGSELPYTHIDKGYLYDFGYNCSGICRLKIKGEAGQKITLRHGERLSDGKFNINSIYTLKEDYKDYIHLLQTDIYILKGGDEEIFVSPFAYHGFRYVFVEGISDKQATKDLLTYIVFNSDVKRRAHFSCSDKTMNTLYEMGIRADLSNFHYFPTDCPHREKNGWTGDVSASCEHILLNFKASESFRSWLVQIRAAQKDSGAIPGIVPTFSWGYDWGNGPSWDSVLANLMYYCYKFDGRTDILEENADSLYKYLKYISRLRNEKGLIEYGLGDWTEPGVTNERFSSPQILTNSAETFDIARKSEYIFGVLGMKGRQKYASVLADELKFAMREHLLGKENCVAAGSCQTSQALFLSYGIFSRNEEKKAVRKLCDIIEKKGGHIACGKIGLRVIFSVLVKYGFADTAINMICRDDSPSYGNMIKRGATALCEATEEDGVHESENHHFLGDIIRVFSEDIAGLKINPYMRDINEVLISPAYPSKLDFAAADYETPKGVVSAKWEKCMKGIKIYADIPKGVKASFKMPDGKLRPLSPGIHTFYI